VPSDVHQIQLQVQLNFDDYARYSAIVGKHQSTWPDLAIYTGAFFLAIPAALAARALAALETASPVAIGLAGRFSLIAFFAGLFTFTLATWIVRRRAIARALSAVPNALDSKTVVLDENAVAITGKLSQAKRTWPSITRVTAEQGLVLLWIGSQNAVIIPDRAFSNSDARNNTIAFASASIARAQSGQR
jgi:hypothetical protein